MAETWIQRVARVYKEKKAKDPNYKYKNAMKDAKVGYTALAEPAAATKSTKAKKSKKGGGEPTDEVIKGGPVPESAAGTEDSATNKVTDDGAAVGGKPGSKNSLIPPIRPRNPKRPARPTGGGKSKKRSRKTKSRKSRKSRKGKK